MYPKNIGPVTGIVQERGQINARIVHESVEIYLLDELYNFIEESHVPVKLYKYEVTSVMIQRLYQNHCSKPWHYLFDQKLRTNP